MKLNFDPNQEYQLEAIQAVVDLFEGQPLSRDQFEFSLAQQGTFFSSDSGFGNNLMLSDAQLLENLQRVQDRQGLRRSTELVGLNFSVEMETGTGKTYAYLRAIYELRKHYGFTKFVIVTPSIAIREGVQKNLEITFDHFQTLYAKTPASFMVYDSKKISSLRSFAVSNTIQILVINIDSFAKDVNIINQPNDRLTGRKPIEFIQATRPIVIVDEPQNMETDLRRQAIANLRPTCTLRYSATHKFVYNLIYQLSPVKAYDLGLVKQIEVDSVYAENSHNQAFLQIEGFKSTRRTVSARVTIEVNSPRGVVKKTFTVRVGDNLYKLSNGREVYRQGYLITGIDTYYKTIELNFGDIIEMGQTRGGLQDEIMRVQLQKTIEEHLQKERQLKEKGIKVLSLFFIDRVANYRQYDENGQPRPGKLAQWFEEIYNDLTGTPRYRDIIPFPVTQVHNGYFAQDKKGNFKDSRENQPTQADNETFQLIMRDKERLLDINTPLRFIFSHSALREGWDNPNVFQICTLNETQSELKKRQEIGRGLRLAVDQSGYRVHDKAINRLTVIANESYEDFAKQLQKEIEDECGVEFTGRIKKKQDRVQVELRKGFDADEKFLDLWRRIRYKTIYRVRFEADKLIERAAEAVNKMPEITRPAIRSERAIIDIGTEGVAGQQARFNVYEVETGFTVMPDIIGYIQSRTELTRATIMTILKKSGRLLEVLINPQLFLDTVVKRIQYELYRLMIDGIKYTRLGDQAYYTMEIFEGEEIERYVEELHKVTKTEKTIANYIVIDSMSSIERQFAEDCENNEQVEFYLKLPRRFKIETPIGSYTPDWALVFKNEKKLYFVAETKSTLDDYELRTSEAQKIACGKAHFAEFEDVEFKQVRRLRDLTH